MAFASHAAIVTQKSVCSPTAEGFSINSFVVDFIQPFLTYKCESRPISFPDGTSWTLMATYVSGDKLNFSIKYHGKQSILASAALKITSKSCDKSSKELNERQNIDIATINQHDPARKNMISGPIVVVSFPFIAQCIIITVDVSIHVKLTKASDSSPSRGLHKDLTEMFQKGSVSDVELKVGDGEKIAVHKFVLCARSAVFLTMFENQMQESQTNEIVITDATADIVKEFVTYLYSDTCQITADTVVSLLQMAHKYAVRGLVELCESELLKGLAVQNVVDLLVLSETYELVALKRAGIELFAQNYTQVSAEKSAELKTGVVSWSLLLEIIWYSMSR